MTQRFDWEGVEAPYIDNKRNRLYSGHRLVDDLPKEEQVLSGHRQPRCRGFCQVLVDLGAEYTISEIKWFSGKISPLKDADGYGVVDETFSPPVYLLRRLLPVYACIAYGTKLPIDR